MIKNRSLILTRIGFAAQASLILYSDLVLHGRSGFGSRQGQEISFPLHSVQAGSELHQASYPMLTGGYFLGDKAART
jgi:hypothetical protein